MTITTHPYPDFAPPPGAEAGFWLEDGYRDIYQPVGTVFICGDIMRCPLVTATARQHLDGHLANIAVEVDGAGHEPLTAAQARELAGFLNTAADEIDRWATR